MAPCFPLPFLHCNTLSAFSPPLCGQISLAIFCEPSLSRILVGIITRWNMGSRSSLPPGCIFLLARSLRTACSKNATWFLRLGPYSKKNFDDKTYIHTRQYMRYIKYIRIVHTCMEALARTLRLACVLHDFLAWRHITKLKNHINVSVVDPQG